MRNGALSDIYQLLFQKNLFYVAVAMSISFSTLQTLNLETAHFSQIESFYLCQLLLYSATFMNEFMKQYIN